MAERGEVVNGSPDMSGRITRTEDERAAIVARAREVERELIRSVKAIRSAGVHFARYVHEYLADRLWEVDYESPQEGLAHPGIGVGLGHAKNLALVYRTLVLERNVPVDQLLDVDLRTVQYGLPAIKAGERTWQEVVDDAKVYPRSEMARKYGDKRGPNAALDAGGEPERRTCPTCGSYVEADRIGEAA